MVGVEAAMLAFAALAFTLFLWLLSYGRDHSRADFAAYADAHGWNHRPTAPRHLVGRAAEWVDGLRLDAPHGPYFAGPSGAGPFQVFGLQHAKPSLRSSRGAWTGDRALVHIRTATTCPGIRFGPRSLLAPRAGDVAPDAVGHSAFLERYVVRARDQGFVGMALDYETCALLLQPAAGVMGEWKGQDLYLMFPLRPGTMAGYETLLRYAVALTRRLERHDGRPLPLAERPMAPPVAVIGTPADGRPVPA